MSNPKTLHVDFSTEEDFNKAQENVGTENTQTSTIPGTVEDWLREQDMKREKGDGVCCLIKSLNVNYRENIWIMKHSYEVAETSEYQGCIYLSKKL